MAVGVWSLDSLEKGIWNLDPSNFIKTKIPSTNKRLTNNKQHPLKFAKTGSGVKSQCFHQICYRFGSKVQVHVPCSCVRVREIPGVQF